MPITVTPRALAVIRRGFEAARLDPAAYAVRVRALPSGIQTSFQETPQEGDEVVETDGVRLFVPPALAARNAVLDVGDEHERLTLR